MSAITAPRIGAGLTIVVAAIIFAASVLALLVEPGTFETYQNQFESVVTNTLLPLLEVTLAALVVFVVGSMIASSLGRR
jgi:hypothetical protein